MKCLTQFVENPTEKFDSLDFDPEVIIILSDLRIAKIQDFIDGLSSSFPKAQIVGCSTAGNISGSSMKEEAIAVTFISSEKGHLKVFWDDISSSTSEDAGKSIAKQLQEDSDLRHAFVLSEGLDVNGSELASGLRAELNNGVNVTGGLGGDSNDFEETWVIDKEGKARGGLVCAVGFYGKFWAINYGSKGGWNTFGIERRVTRSKENVLFEIDGQPALQLYKSYLGERSTDLPASGLLFPLSMRQNAEDPPLVRTILSVSEEDQSLTFAGDIPEGAFVKLMKANFDRLIDGAGHAAEIASLANESTPELTLLVSCVGRKLVLKQLVEEEIEAIEDRLNTSSITGFYSYGELAPFSEGMGCELHNQTMTITAIRED